ncbi:transcription termination factor MTERF8, chloroplastic-like [Triticum dicoccoides]|uniref:transcription termination factor MTERF8, chloroplastic-like n=1 Tax=Triticum dicoccoides TaxID=85692 RepID=UPI001891E6C0|nr:transcription termination factor MTERF8, chloroplastic-like [Triticum dicoccoides]XP_037444950.1 transcription termination factor MTERF8, chloroplastic-like [Triticum dicoccoides]XP_037444951.1 transcription termination factor MTERF8, chloroplastic-like [Triticum dicoccoides]XP_037444953.1 transcription termination factor MTERF8, chloroplastic-like [Triticum dicoccoides]
MLRLRRSLLSQILSSPFASPISHLSRFISAAAPAVSRNPRFAVEEYLVSTCGLTRPQALKAFPKLSHLKSPTKPDAVLAFLAGLSLSPADVAAVVAKDPKFLCASVEKTLAPVVVGLTGLGLGLSRSQIARLVSLIGVTFRCRSIIAGLQYCLPLFGSSENLLRALPLAGGSVLGSDLERVVKPNVSFLLECGLGACDIAKLYAYTPSPLSISTERIRTAVACIDSLGVHRGSPMFRHALQAVAFLSEEKITTKVEHLKKAFRWSDAEVGIAVSKAPTVLTRSENLLQSKSDFLISEVGLEPAYIAHRPIMLTYSLEGRLRPRYYVVRFLKENGLLDHDRDYYAAVMISEKVFVEKFICPHKDAAPHLAEDYATACRGEVPAR